MLRDPVRHFMADNILAAHKSGAINHLHPIPESIGVRARSARGTKVNSADQSHARIIQAVSTKKVLIKIIGVPSIGISEVCINDAGCGLAL